MEDFRRALEKRVLLFDGSMGALLGVETDCPDLLSVDRPDIIRGIHEAYIRAGADVILTNTFGATPLKLERSGHASRFEEIVAAAVKNARAAGAPYVGLDLGPSGGFLAPVGDIRFERMLSSLRAFCQSGADAGADLIVIETQTDLAEMRCALIAARETGLPVVASSTYSQNARTLTGGAPECAALISAALGAAAAGINCSGGPKEMLRPLRAMREVSPIPVVVQPNAGLPAAGADGRAVFPFVPEAMLPHMAEILSAGASAIGGCCGTTPEHIEKMRTLIDGAHAPAPAWDGIKRICSSRSFLTVAEAEESLAEVSDIEDLFDLEPDAVPIISLNGLSPEDARATVEVAQTMTKAPLAFRADTAEPLDAALEVYAGVALVDGRNLSEIAARWGAVVI